MKAKDPRASQVLHFWFGEPPGARDKRWFEKSAAFDAEIRALFADLCDEAAAGRLAQWQANPRDCLALVLVLDQLTRNIYRGEARAFAADSLALDAARTIVAHGWDREMLPVERMFAYLPFEHSETLADQLRGCELMEGLSAYPETADAHFWAVKHRDIIRRFGRFPHRNAALGRASTPAELEFLKEPGSGF
ncbi:MAG: DUF924 family protein [Burkholderiales bacterium]